MNLTQVISDNFYQHCECLGEIISVLGTKSGFSVMTCVGFKFRPCQK